MRGFIEEARALFEKKQNPNILKAFKALGGSVKKHKTDSKLLVVRLPRGKKKELQQFLDQHDLKQALKSKTGKTYELAFVSKSMWPKPVVVSKPAKPKPKTALRHETIRGVKVVFGAGVSDEVEKITVAQLLHARDLLKTKRFGDAWGGIIHIPGTKKSSLNGTYQRRTDTTVLYPRISKRTIIHELGHRWWYRNTTRPRRLQFINWIKSGLAPVSHYGGKDPWEAFAEVFMYFVLDKNMTPQQVETFKLIARGGRFESVHHDMKELIA